MVLGQAIKNNFKNYNYATVQWPDGSIISNSSTSKEFTITTHGRPVFAIVTGDMNNTSDGAWFWMQLYRDGTLLESEIVQGYSSGVNNPFMKHTLDVPPAGVHTYTCTLCSGSGSA